MDKLVPDLYSYIGEFLDDVSLLHFTSTSKTINIHTEQYRKKRITPERLSKIRKIASLKGIKYLMEIYYGPNLPNNKDALVCNVLQNIGKNYGLYGALVYPKNYAKQIVYNADITKYCGEIPTTISNSELNKGLKISMEEGELSSFVVTFQCSDKIIESTASWLSVITQKFFLKYSTKPYISDDNKNWLVLPNNEKITKTFYRNDYAEITLSLFVKDNIINLLDYQVIINDIPLFKRKIVDTICQPT